MSALDPERMKAMKEARLKALNAEKHPVNEGGPRPLPINLYQSILGRSSSRGQMLPQPLKRCQGSSTKEDPRQRGVFEALEGQRLLFLYPKRKGKEKESAFGKASEAQTAGITKGETFLQFVTDVMAGPFWEIEDPRTKECFEIFYTFMQTGQTFKRSLTRSFRHADASEKRALEAGALKEATSAKEKAEAAWSQAESLRQQAEDALRAALEVKELVEKELEEADEALQR